MRILQKEFGKVDHQDVYEYALKNDNGIEIGCLNFGCAITKIITPDKRGNFENIALGFDSLEEYEENPPYFAAVIGPVAGRIKGAEFELNGNTYQLEKNDGENHIHGGVKGFHNRVWHAEPIEGENEVSVRFSYTSPDGEGGYPGNVTIQVTYTLNNSNEFTIQYEATTDQATLVNVTNHTYFNLSGNAKRDVLDHVLKLDSDQFLELNKQSLPTGKWLDVEGTVFDFRSGRKIKDGVQSEHPQIQLVGGGYDHPFLLKSHHNGEIILWDEQSGRKLVVETDEPGVVLYTANHLGGNITANGVKGRKHLGICLETQGLPDAIHHPSFPTIVLNKDEIYSSVTKWTFLTE